MKTHTCDRSGHVRFDGDDYVPERDNKRLTGQIERVYALVSDGQWRTLAAIAHATGDPESSVSAQLRHLRKPRFGSFRVEKEFIKSGLYRYRVLPPVPVGAVRAAREAPPKPVEQSRPKAKITISIDVELADELKAAGDQLGRKVFPSASAIAEKGIRSELEKLRNLLDGVTD